MEDNTQKTAEPLDPDAIARAVAVREAMCEIMNENRSEILRRARAKLVAQGINVELEVSANEPQLR
jgi:hypothetical protein